MPNDSEMLSDQSLTSLSDQDKLFQEAHRKKIIENIPLIVFFFVTAVIGIIGNILTIAFYGFRLKRTPTFFLITLLAVVDLIVCFLCFTTLADLYVNIKFTNAIICKLMYFLDHWLMQSSMAILWIISIHRYRRICRPFEKQLTIKTARIVVIIASGFSMIYCANIFVTYNPVKVNISTTDVSLPKVVGHYCTSTDDASLKDVLLTFHGIDALIVTASLITFVYTYGNIWRTVRNHKRRHANIQTLYPLRQMTLPSIHDTIKKCSASSKENYSLDQFTSQFDYTTDSFSNQNTDFDRSLATIERKTVARSARKIQKSSKSPMTSTRQRNITRMMFAVTVGLVICFTPYFASVGIRAMSVKSEDELNTGMELALRFPFLNSVINPIIFSVFNSEYRRFVKEKFIKCSK